MKKIVLSITSGLILILGFAASSAANTFVDEQVATRPAPPDLTPGWTGVNVDDLNRQHFGSFIMAGGHEILGGSGTPYSSFADVKNSGSTTMTYNAILPPCSETITNDCIASVQAIKSDGTVIVGNSSGLFPNMSAPAFTGDTSIGIPSGWAPSLWRFPGLNHSGGDQFMVTPTAFDYGAEVAKGDSGLQLQVGVSAVSLTPTTPQDGNSKIWPNVTSQGCNFWIGGNQCAVQWPLPDSTRFRVVIKLSGSVSGWVHGRLSSPTIEISPNGNNGQIFDITAGAEKVPVLTVWKKYSDLAPELKTLLASQTDPRAGRVWPDNWRDIWNGLGTAPYPKLSVEHDLSNYDVNDFSEFSLWLAESDNKASATKSEWDFYTSNPNGGDTIGSTPCAQLTKGVTGVVSSNSTMYLAAPPVFNASQGTLDYQVAAPHFDRNGNVNVGSYDLIINSDVARCLYGFSKAPLQATVSVVSSDGTNQVATSVLSEANGWLHLQVAGFTYSSPTLRVKLTQEASAQPSVAAKVRPTTIRCVKAKSIKSVTGIKPKCPPGYRAK